MESKINAEKLLENFNGEKPIEIPNKETQRLVSSYLVEVKKRSDGSYKNNKNHLNDFFNFRDYGERDIKTFRRRDVKRYFAEIVDIDRCRGVYIPFLTFLINQL